MGIVWRCAVRVEVEGQEAREEELFVKVRRAASVDEGSTAPRGGGW
jgi:hypothetical protein